MIPLPAIIIGSWILVAIVVYIITPLFPMGTIYANAEDLERDTDKSGLIFTSLMWPMIIALFLPMEGIEWLREWVKEARLKRLSPNVRIELDEENDDEEDDWDEDDLDEDEDDEDDIVEDVELNYRTMSCHSCGHTVEKSE